MRTPRKVRPRIKARGPSVATNAVAEITGAPRFLQPTASSRGKVELGTPNRRRFTKVYLSRAPWSLSSRRLKRPAWKRRVPGRKRTRRGDGGGIYGLRKRVGSSRQARKPVQESRSSSKPRPRVSRTRKKPASKLIATRIRSKEKREGGNATVRGGDGATGEPGAQQESNLARGSRMEDERPPEFDHGTFYYPGASSSVEMRYGRKGGSHEGSGRVRGNRAVDSASEEEDEEDEEDTHFRNPARRRKKNNSRSRVSVHDGNARLESLLEAFNAAVRTSHQGTSSAPVVIPISMPVPVPMYTGASAAPAATPAAPRPAGTPTSAEETQQRVISTVARVSEEVEKKMAAMAESTVRLSKAAGVATEALESIPALFEKVEVHSKASAERYLEGKQDSAVDKPGEPRPALTLNDVSAMISGAIAELKENLDKRLKGQEGQMESDDEDRKREATVEAVEDEQRHTRAAAREEKKKIERAEFEEESKERPLSRPLSETWGAPSSLQVSAKGGATPSAQIHVDIARIVKDVIVELSPRIKANTNLVERPKAIVASAIAEDGPEEKVLEEREVDFEEEVEREIPTMGKQNSIAGRSAQSLAPTSLDEARLSQIIAEQLELAEVKRRARDEKIGGAERNEWRQIRRVPQRGQKCEQLEEGDEETRDNESDPEEPKPDLYTLKQLDDVRNFFKAGEPSSVGTSNYATPSKAKAKGKRKGSFHWASVERRAKGDERKDSKLLAVDEVKEMLRRLEEDDSERREQAALIDRQVFQLLLHLEKRRQKARKAGAGSSSLPVRAKASQQGRQEESKGVAERKSGKAQRKTETTTANTGVSAKPSPAKGIKPLLGTRSVKVDRKGSVAVKIEGDGHARPVTPGKLSLGQDEGNEDLLDVDIRGAAPALRPQGQRQASTMLMFPLPERDPLLTADKTEGTLPVREKENDFATGPNGNRTPKWLKPLSRMGVTGGESIQSTSRFANDVRMVSDAFRGQMWSPKL